MIRVHDARFVGAAARAGAYPERADPAVGRAPEIAFAGRSNVGKSSLINSLCAREKLARISRTPGRTRQLNFYVVALAGGPVVLVDLPGYGYARVSCRERAGWGPLVERFLAERVTLCGVVLVVDVRRGIENEEDELLIYLRRHHRPVVVAATKTDTVPHGRRAAALRAIADAAGDLPVVPVSGRTRDGRDDLWRRLLALRPGNGRM